MMILVGSWVYRGVGGCCLGPENSGSARGLGVADLRLCLDFANTEGVVRNGPPDRLDELDLFLAWATKLLTGQGG